MPAPGPRARAADVACFGGLSPYEVLAGGRKVVGLSQARRRQGTLLQAGVLLDLDAARLARLLDGGDRLAADLTAAAAGLRERVPGVEPDDVAAAVDPSWRPPPARGGSPGRPSRCRPDRGRR